MFDLKNCVLDEIALEGLDGITVDSLWVRLKEANFPLDLNDKNCKNYVWNYLILKQSNNGKNLEFFSLPKERSTIILYDRYKYVSPETGYCVNNEESIPDDIYSEIVPINTEKYRGSCQFFEQRINQTEKVLKENYSLSDINKIYGKKLVIVADQKIREKSLRILYTDPYIDLSPIQYCIIERVGRGRKIGEITFGKESANFKEQPKTLFYFRKLLLKKGLITKQMHTIYNTKTLSIKRGLLLMLPRFHIDRKSPIESAAIKLVDILKKYEDFKCDYQILKRDSNIKPKPFKHVFSEFQKNFRLIEQESIINDKKVKLKYVQLLKPLDEDEDELDTDEENDDLNEKTPSIDKANVKLFSPENILINRTLLSQSYNIVESCSILNGISLREFQSELILPRLDARLLIRMLERLNEVTTISTNLGRQKIIRYFLRNRINKDVAVFNNENNLDLGKKFTLTYLRRANLILKAVKDNKIIDQLIFFKKIILEAEKNLPFMIDQKSIKKILQHLAAEGHIKWIKKTLESCNTIKKYNVFCIPSLSEDNELVRERIEQAKFKYFSINHDIDNILMKKNQNENDPLNKNNFSLLSSMSFRNDEAELIYQPSAGRKYGLEPKMKKIITFYKFIFFTLSDECKKENNYEDWRRFITPLPKCYEKDVCLLGDLIPRIPLSVFVKVVFITFLIPGLEEFLQDPIKRHYTLQMLPTDILRNLFRKRKYIFSMVEVLTLLTYLNLVKLSSTHLSIKESVTIQLLKETSFVEEDYVKIYQLENSNDLEIFINDLTLHGSKNDCKKCSFDPRLYIHNPRNWSYLPKIHRNLQIKEIKRFARLMKNVVDDPNSNIEYDDEMSESTRTSIKRKKFKNTKNDLKKKKIKLNNNAVSNELDDDNLNDENDSFKKESSKDYSNLDLTNKSFKRKGYDKEDIYALSLLRKQRSEWSKEEDSFLLMCRVASVLLHPSCINFVCVSKKIIRDELYKYLPNLSYDKTSKACQRRVMYMLKNSRTKSHVLDWVAECKQDPELSSIKKPNVPTTHVEEWNNTFVDLLHKLLKKFQNDRFNDSSKIQKFKTIGEIYKKFNLIESEIHCVPHKPVLHFQPNNVVDIYINVVLNVLSSSLLINLFDNTPEYNTKSTLTLFKIYQRYPDTMIRSVVNKMKQNGIMAKLKANEKVKLNSKSKKLSLFKISQHYRFVLKSKFCMDILPLSIKLDENFTIKDHFGPSEVAILTNLVSMNKAIFKIDIPENFVSNELMNSQNIDKNLDTLVTKEDLKSTSRVFLCSLRQKFNKQTDKFSLIQDYLVLNKCNITCQVSNNTSFNFDSFNELLDQQTSFINPDNDYLNDIQLDNLERLIIKEILNSKELGLSFKHLFNSLLIKQSLSEQVLNETLNKLIEQKILFKVGVEEIRYVTHKYVFPWLVHAQLPNTSKQKPKSQKQVDSNTDYFDEMIDSNLIINESSENTSSQNLKPKMIYFFPRFWKNPFGELEKKVLFMFLSGVLGHVMVNPGICKEDLVNHFQLCLPPIQTLEIIDLLISGGCLLRKKIKFQTGFSLFESGEEKICNYYEPTEQAFVNLCAIKNEFNF